MLTQAWKSYRARNYELAYQECKKAEENCGQSAEYHHLMAIILWQIQEPLLAQNHFDVSLFLQPDNGDCMCDYAQFLLAEDEPVKAQQCIRRCIETGTKKEQAFLLMAKSHIALNELPQARDNLKRCLELHPTSKSARREMVKLEKRMARLGNLKNLTVDELCQRVQDLETSCEKLSEKESQARCVVCLLKERNQVNVLCGHCSVCEECSKSVSACPLCRKRVKFIRVFM